MRELSIGGEMSGCVGFDWAASAGVLVEPEEEAKYEREITDLGLLLDLAISGRFFRPHTRVKKRGKVFYL